MYNSAQPTCKQKEAYMVYADLGSLCKHTPITFITYLLYTQYFCERGGMYVYGAGGSIMALLVYLPQETEHSGRVLPRQCHRLV